MQCEKCGEEIPLERLRFLRQFHKDLFCVDCSPQDIPLVLTEYAHKTAGYIVIAQTEEEKRRALRAYKRSR